MAATTCRDFQKTTELGEGITLAGLSNVIITHDVLIKEYIAGIPMEVITHYSHGPVSFDLLALYEKDKLESLPERYTFTYSAWVVEISTRVVFTWTKTANGWYCITTWLCKSSFKADTEVVKPASFTKYKYGQVVTVPGFCMDVIDNEAFLETISKVPSVNVFHTDYKGNDYPGFLNTTDKDLTECLGKMEAGDTLRYCQDIPELGRRVAFYWTKLMHGWICTSVRARGELLAE